MRWSAVAGLLLGLTGYWLLAGPSARMFGGLGDPEGAALPLPAWVIGYLVTLAGVVLGAGFRRVLRVQTDGKQQVNVTRLAREVFRSTDLWLGLLGSPLLFALIVKTLAGLDMPGIVAVSLQNGFFCATLVTELVAKGGKPAS
jgi:hypothetical protein